MKKILKEFLRLEKMNKKYIFLIFLFIHGLFMIY